MFIIRNREPQERVTRYLGMTTDNIAEYTAATRTPDWSGRPARRVECQAVRGPELLVRQINGPCKVKKEGLKPLYARAKELIAKISSVEVQYLPRANKEADALVNKATDEKIGN